MEALETCPVCKGTGEVGNDGQGHVYLCERCEGFRIVWVTRKSMWG